MDYTISEISIQNAPDIAQLNKELGYSFPENKVKRRISQILETSFDKIFTAVSGNKVIGYIHISPYQLLFDDPLINILGFVVLHDYRKSGVGSALIKYAEEYSRSRGYSGIRLVSGIDRTEAHSFYESHGYKNRKTQKNYVKKFTADD